MKKLTSLLLAIGVFCATAFTASAQAPLQYRVDDVADLLAITLYGSDAKVTAWVGGNTTRDDGLGGMFYYDGNSSAATNVYAVFKPTNNAGRWFKLPTAVAWQNEAVTVGNDTTYGFKFLRGTGQTNFFGIGADNNIVYLQTFNGKNLHINNLGNDVIFNGGGSTADVKIQSDTNPNHFSADGGAFGGAGAFTFGSAVSTETFFNVNQPAFSIDANSDFNRVKIGAGNAVTVPAGTSAYVGTLDLGEPNITATGNVTSAYTLRIGAAPTEGASNYALWVDAGLSKLDGALSVDGAITNANLTASLPVFTDAGKALVSQSVAATKTALGIQAGTAVTTADNTVTNTFATAFSVAPVVVTTPTGAAGTTCLTNAVISVSTTGFVYNCGVPSVTIQWVAIGAP